MGMAVETADVLIPQDATLPVLREIAAGCRACDLWQRGTQTVFGEGKARAELLLAGEQPGNRSQTYVTNVVKHFKWEARGKRRIHAKPNAAEVKACMPWLRAEIREVRPEVIVCLGATAAQALIGKAFRVTKQRGELLPFPLAPAIMATWHPSAILRAPDEDARRRQTQELIEDLRRAAAWLRETAAGALASSK